MQAGSKGMHVEFTLTINTISHMAVKGLVHMWGSQWHNGVSDEVC